MRLISVRAGTAASLGVQAGDRWLPATDLDPGRTVDDGRPRAGRASTRSPRSVPPSTKRRIARDGRPVAEAELLAPVGRPGKVIAIGRNYREHADEEGVDTPPAPLIFAKWPSSIVGPDAEIRWDPR